MAEPHRAVLTVTVAWSPKPRHVEERTVTLPVGATVTDAVAAVSADLPDVSGWEQGVWGRPVSADRALADGDRVELCRPLRVDPKVARRERFQKQGARGAGLFARRRPGAKPGY